jgi:hypothetical protein
MPNRVLTPAELKAFRPLFKSVLAQLDSLSGEDKALFWALQRKLAKSLIYEERGTPTHRRRLKALKRKQQNGLCALRDCPLPEKNVVLDRIEAMKGYTPENTQLLCRECDYKLQVERRFK